MTGLKEALTEIWLPYLNGVGTRDAALAALAERTGIEPPIFTYRTDDFWLNLHHFLYALGLAEAKSPDASRPALAPAATERQRAIAQLTSDEQPAWADAVTLYATDWSGGTGDRKFASAVVALANAGNVPTLAADIDPALRATLERVAPIYRRVWWRVHVTANRAWQAQNAALVAQYGSAIRSDLAHAYPIDWPLEGRLVHVTAYANFGGAYSLVNGGLLVVSSREDALAALLAQATTGSNDLRSLIVVAIARRMRADVRHREAVAHGGRANRPRRYVSAVTTSSAVSGGDPRADPSRLLAGPVRNDSIPRFDPAMHFIHDGPHHIET